MNCRLMSYNLKHKDSSGNYVLQTSFWSFSNFERMPVTSFKAIDTKALTNNLMALIPAIEEPLSVYGVFNYLGYTESCTLTDFVDGQNAQIVSIQFQQLYPSPDSSRFPHLLGVDVFVCDKEIDFASLCTNSAAHSGSATTFHLL